MSVTLTIPTSVHEYIARAEESKKCVSAIPDQNGHVPPGSCDAFYMYYPSFALAIVFTALFLLTTVGHVFQAFYHKKRFCFIVIIGAAWELASFGLRIISTRNQQKKGITVFSFMLFALAPLWINAFVYMIAGRLIFCFHAEKRVFKFKAMSIGRIFIISDIFAFLVQMVGASMISPGADPKLQNVGLKVYQAGMGIQQAFLLVFIVIIVGFHKTMLELAKGGWRDNYHRKWKWMTWILYLVLLMITIRIIYRLAEFIIPHDNNPLLENEVYMYALDAVPMSIALFALNILPPGRVLIGLESDYSLQKKQIKAAKKCRNRNGREGSDKEESMIGMGGLPQQQRFARSPYVPVTGAGAVEGGEQMLYDPHHRRM